MALHNKQILSKQVIIMSDSPASVMAGIIISGAAIYASLHLISIPKLYINRRPSVQRPPTIEELALLRSIVTKTDRYTSISTSLQDF